MPSPRPSSDRFRAFVRDYTQGMSSGELRRLFDREASQVFEVLTRDQKEPEPKDGVSRFFHRAKLLFLSISYKLKPGRRMLFAASMLATLLSIFSFEIVTKQGPKGGVVTRIDTEGLWALIAIACLVFLLALEMVDRIRVRDELEVARQLQRDLLPQSAPALPGWGFAHSYRTANEVGGDYYDFLPVEGGRLALVVGDASGHGMAAGLVMAIANATLRTALDLDPRCERVHAVLNRAICRTGDRRTFISLFYGLLEPESGALEFVLAGHPFPLLRRASGEIIELGSGGYPLGIFDPLTADVRRATLEPGDCLLLLSDGLPEALDREERAFGFERLKGLLALGGTPQEIHDRILRAFDEHTRESTIRDDLTLVVVGRMAA